LYETEQFVTASGVNGPFEPDIIIRLKETEECEE